MDVGFRINRVTKYAIRFTHEVAIGSYNCLNSLRSKFVYKCQSDCEGYSIRKPMWIEVVGEDAEIDSYIRQNCRFEYET